MKLFNFLKRNKKPAPTTPPVEDEDNFIFVQEASPVDSEIDDGLSEMNETSFPESQEALSGGVKELEAGNTEEALRIFSQAIDRDPMNPELYRYRGLTLSVSGQLEQSEKDLLKALELSPDDEDIAEDLDKVRQMISLETIKKKMDQGIPFDNRDHIGIINGEFPDNVKINSVYALGNSGDIKMVKELVMIMQEFGEEISDAAAESLRNLTQGNMDAAREALRIQRAIHDGINWRDL